MYYILENISFKFYVKCSCWLHHEKLALCQFQLSYSSIDSCWVLSIGLGWFKFEETI